MTEADAIVRESGSINYIKDQLFQACRENDIHQLKILTNSTVLNPKNDARLFNACLILSIISNSYESAMFWLEFGVNVNATVNLRLTNVNPRCETVASSFENVKRSMNSEGVTFQGTSYENLKCESSINDSVSTPGNTAMKSKSASIKCENNDTNCESIEISKKCENIESSEDKNVQVFQVANFKNTTCNMSECELSMFVDIYQGNSALSLAISLGKVELVELLLLHHADVHNSDGNNVNIRSPLSTAMDKDNVDIVRLLIEAGAHVSMESGNIINSYLTEAVMSGRHNHLKLLLSKGKMDVKGDGWFPLHVAVAKGDAEACSMLLTAGAAVNQRDSSGTLPLILAARAKTHNSLELVTILQEAGADVNMKDKTGLSALHNAVSVGRVDIVRFLLYNGADINIIDNTNMTALQRSIYIREETLAVYLIKENCNFHDFNCFKYPDGSVVTRTLFQVAKGLLMFNLCKFLVLAGYKGKSELVAYASIVTEKNVMGNSSKVISERNFRQELLHKLMTVSHLRHLCRLAIRQTIGAPFSIKVQRTNLPMILQDYLMFPEVSIDDGNIESRNVGLDIA